MSSTIKELVSQYTFLHSIYMDITAAVITFFIVIIIGKLMMKFVTKLLEMSKFDYHFKELTGIETLLAERIGSFGKAVVYLIAVVVGLNYLDITKEMYTLVFTVFMAVFLLAAALRTKDFIPNYYHGLKLKPKRYVKVGDMIKIKNMIGRVKKIKLNGILLELKNRDLVLLPHMSISSEELKKSRMQ